jgi:hypothetical protein
MSLAARSVKNLKTKETELRCLFLKTGKDYLLFA